MAKDPAKALAKRVMSTFTVLPSLDHGAHQLSRNLSFSRHATTNLVICDANPINDYLREMIKFAAIGWHKFLICFVNNY